jgi:hypothetical protein
MSVSSQLFPSEKATAYYNKPVPSARGRGIVSEYVFKLKKGDLELELKSDDAKFIETQMDNWRNMLVTQEER